MNATIDRCQPEGLKLLTRKEAAEFLRVSLCAMNRFVHDPTTNIPFLKVGRRHLFDKRRLVAWAERAAEKSR